MPESNADLNNTPSGTPSQENGAEKELKDKNPTRPLKLEELLTKAQIQKLSATDILHREKKYTILDSLKDEQLEEAKKRIASAESNEEKAKRQNEIDPLTQLPNRRKLIADSGKIIAEARNSENKTPVVILFIDIDFFGNVNKELGHSAGDKILTGVAGRLRNNFRPTDNLRHPNTHIQTPGGVYRLGGEEFVIVSPATKTEDIPTISTRLNKAIANQPFQFRENGHFFTRDITISIGGAVYDPTEVFPQHVIDEIKENYDSQYKDQKDYIPLTDDQAIFQIILARANEAERTVKAANRNGFAMYKTV